MQSSPSITKLLGIMALAATLLSACSIFNRNRAEDELNNSSIAYPFSEQQRPLGISPQEDRFVIRSASGGTEYTVEIPGGARDYDVEVPIADIHGGSSPGTLTRSERDMKPQVTDRELISEMPKTDSHGGTALTDGAFGVGMKGGPLQSPSYTLGIARATDLYKERKFEFALIEVNNLLAFYPTSAKLYKMKGTVLMKLRSLPLAERAWQQALELAPTDTALRKGLDKLRHRIELEQKSAVATKASDTVSPQAVTRELAPLPVRANAH